MSTPNSNLSACIARFDSVLKNVIRDLEHDSDFSTLGERYLRRGIFAEEPQETATDLHRHWLILQSEILLERQSFAICRRHFTQLVLETQTAFPATIMELIKEFGGYFITYRMI